MTTHDDRYARQRLVEWWDQEKLASARVLVAGAGALGNELLKNLALLGVGHLTLVDFDHVELSNLSRTVLFTEANINQSKVAAAAAALHHLNPHLTLTPLHGDLFYDIGLGHYRHSDLIIGCLDSLGARAQVGFNAALAGIPFLDGGMWSLGGEVRWFMAGDGPCFDCTLTAADRARADERRSCTGFRDPAWDETTMIPTVATTAATIGGILAQEAAKYLCGYPVNAGKAIVYNGQTLTLHRAELRRDPACTAPHQPYPNVHELACGVTDLTPRQLLAQAQADYPGATHWRVELGRDFLLAFVCPNCHRNQTIHRLWGQVLETERLCPHCGSFRNPDLLRSVDATSPYAAWPFSRLGVPPAELLAVMNETDTYFYELTADIPGSPRAITEGSLVNNF